MATTTAPPPSPRRAAAPPPAPSGPFLAETGLARVHAHANRDLFPHRHPADRSHRHLRAAGVHLGVAAGQRVPHSTPEPQRPVHASRPAPDIGVRLATLLHP